MGTIDGVDWTGVTIDGQDVTEITVDGTVVWTAGPEVLINDDMSTDPRNNSLYTVDISGGTATHAGSYFNWSGGDNTSFNIFTTEYYPYEYYHYYVDFDVNASTGEGNRVFTGLQNPDNSYIAYSGSYNNGYEAGKIVNGAYVDRVAYGTVGNGSYRMEVWVGPESTTTDLNGDRQTINWSDTTPLTDLRLRVGGRQGDVDINHVYLEGSNSPITP